MAQMAKMCAERVASGTLVSNEVNDRFYSKPYAKCSIPDVDLLIRTGGEARISNFMLWSLTC